MRQSRLARALVAASPKPVGNGQDQHAGGEGERKRQPPDELRRIGLFFQIEIPSQRVDRGDADYRAEQFLLELAEIDLSEALGPVRMFGGIDAADEVFL